MRLILRNTQYAIRNTQQRSNRVSVTRLLKGALAGTIATGPMTVAMLLLYALLPRHERFPAPPEQITSRFRHGKSPLSFFKRPSPPWLAWVLHFAFGAGIGALYAPLAPAITEPPPLRGIAYGLTVWFTSYEGWLPAAEVLPPASRQDAGRNLMMISAHVVWGAVLDAILSRLDEGEQQPSMTGGR